MKCFISKVDTTWEFLDFFSQPLYKILFPSLSGIRVIHIPSFYMQTSKLWHVYPLSSLIKSKCVCYHAVCHFQDYLKGPSKVENCTEMNKWSREKWVNLGQMMKGTSTLPNPPNMHFTLNFNPIPIQKAVTIMLNSH